MIFKKDGKLQTKKNNLIFYDWKLRQNMDSNERLNEVLYTKMYLVKTSTRRKSTVGGGRNLNYGYTVEGEVKTVVMNGVF